MAGERRHGHSATTEDAKTASEIHAGNPIVREIVVQDLAICTAKTFHGLRCPEQQLSTTTQTENCLTERFLGRNLKRHKNLQKAA